MQKSFWRLPQGSECVATAASERREALRRSLLRCYRLHGYRQLDLPVLEYSLGQPPSPSWNRHFHFTDPLSTEMVRLRSDATHQVVRAAAHLGVQPPARFCYAARVFHREPEVGDSNRFPLQMGVEFLDGAPTPQADVEVAGLMVQTLNLAGIAEPRFSLGHAGLVRTILDGLGLDEELRESAFRLLRRRSAQKLEALLREQGQQDTEAGRATLFLCGAHGPLPQLLDRDWGATPLAPWGESLAQIAAVAEALRETGAWSYDLGEIHGRRYHDGMVFAGFSPSAPSALARGGRYRVGEAWATGMSARLDLLLAAAGDAPSGEVEVVAPPLGQDQALEAAVRELREAGRAVVRALPGQDPTDLAREMGGELLRLDGGAWRPERPA